MRLFRLNDVPTGEAEVHHQLVQRQQLPPDRDHYLELLIVHRRYGAIGLAALADYAPLHRRAEYLIGLFDQTHRGIGHGLETTLMMLDLAFNTYKLHKVYASTYGYNHLAQQFSEGLGFQLEGQRQDHVFDQIAGCFVDLYDYGMTVDRFRQNQRLVSLSQRLIGRDITRSAPPHESTSPEKIAPDRAPTPEIAPPRFVLSGSCVLRAPPQNTVK